MQAIPPSLALTISVLNLGAALIASYLTLQAWRARRMGIPGMGSIIGSFSIMVISFLASASFSVTLSSPPRAPPRVWLSDLAANHWFIAIQLSFTLSYLLLAIKATSPAERLFSLIPLLPAAIILYVALVSYGRASKHATAAYLGLGISHLMTFLSLLYAKPWLLVTGETVRPVALLLLIPVLRVKG